MAASVQAATVCKIMSLFISVCVRQGRFAANVLATIHLKNVTVAELPSRSGRRAILAYNNADIDLTRVVSVDAGPGPSRTDRVEMYFDVS